MENDRNFQNEGKKTIDNYILFTILKDKHKTYIDSIPERYKRKNYIIDKFNTKKKNID